MKKYIAKTDVSVCVVLPGGGHTRVSFLPQTDGGSVFYTNDEGIQHGLEHHYKYGKQFRLDPDFKVGGRAKGTPNPPKNKIHDLVKKAMEGEITTKEAAKGIADEMGEITTAIDKAIDEFTIPKDMTLNPEDMTLNPEANAEAESAAEETTAATEEADEEGSGLKEVKVSDPGKAKDYLAEEFGAQRTKLKTGKQIEETAAAYGIKFVYD